jgi:TolB-like protein/Tfp pilus assembly protein PilF
MDFGLAKIKGDTEITKLGTTVGTTYYMSPEQTKGEAVDSRTDIWSLGVLLYQMFTGEFPFKGDYDQAVVYSILNEHFPPIKNYNPSIPVKLEFIVQKMLKKNPGERYNNLSELIKDLKISGGEDVLADKEINIDKDIPSIAILPFKNISREEENEYFSDGLAEDIINALSRIKDIKVVAATSAFSFKNKKTDVKEIGKKLNVKTVLEGSVQKSIYNIQVTARLINVENGYYLWSEQYNRIMKDIFIIQGEIISAIIEKLNVNLQKDLRSSFARQHIKNLDAFDWYLKGRYFYSDRSGEGIKKSIECYEKAISIEPDYALAYAGIADACSNLGENYYLQAEKSFPKAIDAAEKAIELDDSVSEAHAAFALANYKLKWDWKSAEKSFLKGIKVKPGYSYCHASYAYFLLMLERFDEAYREISFASELDPLGFIANTNLGYYYFLSREYDSALREFNKALEINPDYSPLLGYIAEVYEQKGLLEKALEIAKQAYNRSEMHPYYLAELGYYYALSGNKIEALDVLEQLKERSKSEFVSSANFVTVYLGLNDMEKIFHWLDKSLEEKAPLMCYLKVHPRFDKIRTVDKLITLMKTVGLT